MNRLHLLVRRVYSMLPQALVFFGLLPALLFVCRDTVRAQTPSSFPTIFIVGDSTARNNADGAQGWGDCLAAYFDSTKVNVLNRAMAGRSSRTFVSEGRWDKVLAEIKPGDFVLIQMGHNDGGPIDSGRARASLPGLGEETREITKADGTKETVHTYGWYMRKMITEAKAKGAKPLLLSLTVRNLWKNGKVERGSGHYKEWITELARSQGVPFVGVTDIIADQYDRLGQEPVKAMFGPDYVHTSPAGADRNASCVVAGLKGIAIHPIVDFLSDKGKAVSAAPALPIPASNASGTPKAG